MILNNINELQEAVDSRDLGYFENILKPTCRTLNTTQNFHAPLMLSAQNIKHLNKIDELQTDAIMLNLEDGVSEVMKPFALRLSALVLSKLTTCSKKIVVRVNELNEGGVEEIEFLNSYMPDAIRVPKIRNVKDVEKALELIDEKIEVHISIETADAWLNLSKLAVSSRVKVFYLGVLDLFAELKLSQSLITPTNPTIHYILSHFLITSKALHVKPVSFVFQDYKNIDEFQKYIELEKSMGYDSKGCISPTQSQVMMSYFDSENIDEAKEIVELFEKSRADGVTGFVSDKYGFIDEPIYKDALNRISIANS